MMAAPHLPVLLGVLYLTSFVLGGRTVIAFSSGCFCKPRILSPCSLDSPCVAASPQQGVSGSLEMRMGSRLASGALALGLAALTAGGPSPSPPWVPAAAVAARLPLAPLAAAAQEEPGVVAAAAAAAEGEGAAAAAARALLLRGAGAGPAGAPGADRRALGAAADRLAVVAAAQQQQRQGGGLATRGLEDDIYKGVWSVCFAPHIYTLSKIFLTEFKPIEYHLLPGNSIESYVRYSNPLIGAGWLNAAGSIDVRDDMSVKITFDNFWWDIQTSEPRSLETFLQDFRTSPPSATDVLVQNIGKAGFLESFSIFPLQYLDETLCIFEFPPLGVKIVASKV